MSGLSSGTAIQYFVWALALIEVILAIYIFIQNWRDRTTLHVSLLILAIAGHNYAVGLLTQAKNVDQAIPITYALASISLFILPWSVLTAIRIFRPAWFQTPGVLRRYLLYAAYLIPLLPVLIATADYFDYFSSSDLYLFRLHIVTYVGGYIPEADYMRGTWAPSMYAISGQIPYFSVSYILLLVFALFFAGGRTVGTRELGIAHFASPRTRRSAWGLFLAALFSGITLFFLAPGRTVADIPRLYLLPGPMVIAFANLFYAAAFAYATFQLPGISQRYTSLQVRLTLIVLIIAAPLIIAITGYFVTQSDALSRDLVAKQLQLSQTTLARSTELWLNLNLNALQTMASRPDIVSMDPLRQKPVLQSMSGSYPYMYLVSVVDPSGMNTARNDDAALTDYKDRPWFQEIIAGKPVSYQVLIGRTSEQPALVVSVPVVDAQEKLIGVAMFASTLTDLAEQVKISKVGESGQAFIVDQNNRVVQHTDTEYTADLRDLSTYTPVLLLRQGLANAVSFTDSDGLRWQAYVGRLSNGWGVVVQQTEDEYLAPLRTLQNISTLIVLLGSIVLVVLIALTVRQSLHPVRVLADTAVAISQGDLSRLAVVNSRDELGLLATAFNQMTSQLRSSIVDLEQRVNERTTALQARTVQLQAAAQVARDAAAIRDVDQLLNEVVRLIAERFGFYHAGIFIIDNPVETLAPSTAPAPSSAYAVLRAANSEGGQRMLVRGHRLQVGQVGIVGYVAETGRPRIALDVGDDAVFFNNPDLPNTRSEMALPLKSGTRVIGVLDVQSIKEQAFTGEDIEILQIVADQVALALDNARLLQDSRLAYDELRALYGEQTRRSWQDMLRRRSLAYRYTPQGVTSVEQQKELYPAHAAPLQAPPYPAPPYPAEESLSATSPSDLTSPSLYSDGQGYILSVPIVLRGQHLGAISLRRAASEGGAAVPSSAVPSGKPWTQEELNVVVDAIAQVTPALENARMLEQTRQRANYERLIAEIASRIRSTTNVETILQTSAREIGQILQAGEVRIQLEPPQSSVETPAQYSASLYPAEESPQAPPYPAEESEQAQGKE